MQNCSDAFRKAIEWLSADLECGRPNWACHTALPFYALSTVGSPLIQEYKELAASDNFWESEWLFDRPEVFFYLHQLGLCTGKGFEKSFDENVISHQTVKGYFYNDFGGCLRFLVSADQYPEARQRAEQYFLENWTDLQLGEIAMGMLALQEYDFWRYEEPLEKMAKCLSDSQQEDGSFGGDSYDEFNDTCLAIMALSRMKAWREVALKAVEYVKRSQRANGCWGRFYEDDGSFYEKDDDTSFAILALNAMGEGPKTAVYQVEWDNILAKQRERFLKPYFVHTSPLYGKSLHVKQIHDRVVHMVNNATGAIRICSLYLDMLYENIIVTCLRNCDQVK
jgi:hypothetical protein